MTLWNDAAALARQWCPPCQIVESGLQAAVTVRDALQTLRDAETNAASLRSSLLTAQSLGIARKEDYDNFDRIRSNLFLSQLELENIVRGGITGLATEVGLIELPRPAVMPAISRPRKPPKAIDPMAVPKMAELTPTGARDVTSRGLGQAVHHPAFVVDQPLERRGYVSARGLGALEEAGTEPWMWAGLALFVIAPIPVLLALVLSDSLSTQVGHFFTVREQGRLYKTLVDGQVAAYQACLQSGTPEVQCREAAGIIMTPGEAGIEISEPPTGTGAYKWIVWTSVALVTVGSLWWFFRTDTGKKALRAMGFVVTRGRGVRGLGRARRLRSLSDPYPSRYNLEI